MNMKEDSENEKGLFRKVLDSKLLKGAKHAILKFCIQRPCHIACLDQ
jgi:hypothetical protein